LKGKQNRKQDRLRLTAPEVSSLLSSPQPQSAIPSDPWQHGNMIVAGTDQYIWIDLGKDEPGMVQQCRYREGRGLVWRDFLVDDKSVLSPVNIET
jgi:hypothetical protein